MRISISIFVFVFLISCKKDECEFFYDENSFGDSIQPHPYFPAYPGSYWIFNDTSLNSITVEPNWMPFKLVNNYDCKWKEPAVVYLPKINSEYLFYDRLLEEVNENYMGENILFSDQMAWDSYTDPEFLYPPEPNYWNQNPYPDKYRHKRKRIDFLLEVTLNSMVFDSVMVIQEDRYLTGGVHENFLFYTYIYYYAKDVGPIRIEIHQTDEGQSPDAIILNLTDYFINN